MEYDYGQPSRGRSYEYFNFLDSLNIQHEVHLFDYIQEMLSSDKVSMNRRLVETVQNGSFDLVIFSLYTDQIDPAAVYQIRKSTKTFCFFHDDTWRRDFVHYWAPHFDYFSSTDPECKNKYTRAGLPHVIYFPFGANERLYRPLDLPKRYDVSFVGGWHPVRAWLISRLRKAGIQVTVAGFGWPSGIIDHKEMINLFNQSRINLNITNSRSWDLRMISKMPIKGLRQLWSPKSFEQLKARHFEINSCGAFQLSYYVDGLDRAFLPGKEIALYIDPDDMIDKVRYYLSENDLRESIAKAGLIRTLADHTFQKRFEHVFLEMGLLKHHGACI